MPLFFAINKIVLTIHHDNLKAWPVYLSIGNLNRKIHQNQIHPNNILISFIPIIQYNNKGDYIKSKIWYKTMEVIIKHIFTLKY